MTRPFANADEAKIVGAELAPRPEPALFRSADEAIDWLRNLHAGDVSPVARVACFTIAEELSFLREESRRARAQVERQAAEGGELALALAKRGSVAREARAFLASHESLLSSSHGTSLALLGALAGE